MIEELQLVFTVRDKDGGVELGVAYTPKYIRAIIKLLQCCQQKSFNPVHGMVKVKSWPIIIGRNSRFFIGEKIYSLAHIIKGANIISVILPPG